MLTILQIMKRYRGNYLLLNNMIDFHDPEVKNIICYLSGEDDGKNEITRVAESVYYLNCPGRINIFSFGSIKKIRQIIDEQNIDIVNCHLEKTLPLGIVAGLLSRKKPLVALTFHGLTGSNQLSLSRKIKNYFYYRFVDKVVTVSRSIRDDFLRENFHIPGEKVSSIQNGLDYSQLFPRRPRVEVRKSALPFVEQRFVYGITGRLAEKKNHRSLIKALHHVVSKHSDVALVIVGNGPLEESLKNLVASLGLNRNVYFLGFRKDIPDLLSAFDAFVFPTYREGLPLSLLEAMACELPVIASNIGCVQEVFGEFDFGEMVDPDDIAGLAEAMIRVFELSESERNEKGSQARKRALNDFNAESMSANYLQLFKEMV